MIGTTGIPHMKITSTIQGQIHKYENLKTKIYEVQLECQHLL
jgi:hypothetical protein